jgi:hypothetical protein
VKSATLPQFTSVTVTQDVKINGATAAYTFTVQPKINFIDGDIFYITFPSVLSFGSTSCSAGLNLKSAPSCSTNQNDLKVVLNSFVSPSGANKFTFTVSGI